MNFIDRSALAIARTIRKNYSEAGSEYALKYSMSLIINTTIAVTITLIIAAFTNHLREALLVLLFYALLRSFSGGLHLSSSLSCCITTIVVMTSLTHISISYWPYGLILDCISIVILSIKAPDGLEKVSRIDPKYFPLLKIISIFIVGSNFYFQYYLMSTAFFIQSLALTQIAYRLVNYLERGEKYEA
jgi:accessory gene regulator B